MHVPHLGTILQIASRYKSDSFILSHIFGSSHAHLLIITESVTCSLRKSVSPLVVKSHPSLICWADRCLHHRRCPFHISQLCAVF